MKLLKRYTQKAKNLTAIDIVTLALVTAAFMLAMAVSVSYVKARYFTGLSRIEVPVATTKNVYAPGELIEGLFFGEVRYSGEVKYTRQLICPNYSEFIPDINTGKPIVDGSATPRKLEGHRSPVGYPSQNVPLATSCIIQFKNLYCIPYLFGCVRREYSYYTQTFTFKPAETASAEPSNEVSEFENPATGERFTLPRQSASNQVAPKSDNRVTNNTTNNSTTNNSTTNNTTPEAEEPGLIESIIKGVDNLLGL